MSSSQPGSLEDSEDHSELQAVRRSVCRCVHRCARLSLPSFFGCHFSAFCCQCCCSNWVRTAPPVLAHRTVHFGRLCSSQRVSLQCNGFFAVRRQSALLHVGLFHLRFVGKAASLLIALLAFALLIYLGCEVTLASLAFLSPLFSMSRGTQGGGGAGERGHADVLT